jgi:lon-related putative ATP-dependent protease
MGPMAKKAATQKGRSIETARVAVADLYNRCEIESLGFETTDDVAPIDGTVGQERAVRSLEFGLSVRGDGFNVYLAGLPGTGRSSTLRATLARIAKKQPPAPDWCYLYNFDAPRRPSVISLPPGRGKALAAHMEGFIAACRREIPRHFETEGVVAQREQLMREVQHQRARAFEELELEAKKRGFSVAAGPMGVATVPLKADGEPMTPQEFEQMPEGDRRIMQARGEELQSMIGQAMLRGRRQEREAQARLEELDRNAALFTITPLLNEVRQEYMDIPKAIEYLEQVQNDILTHLQLFRGETEPQQQIMLPGPSPEEFFTRYKVNVFVDGSSAAGAPVVIENNPNYYTLFGRVDYRSQFGVMTTDHMMIKAGSLHRANGGYLIAQAFDLLTSPLVWETLKRTLRCQEVAIQNLGEQFSAIPIATLDPEPIPLNVKVVLVGNPRVFQVLQQADEEFRKLFRVKADFTIDMDRTPECIRLYAGFISSRVQQEELRPFHSSAVARVIEHGSRIVEHQRKLSTQFIEIADVLTEADYWASMEGASIVHAEHVERAIEERILRSNLIEERVREVIADGTILIDVDGERVGEVNGLSVYDLGDYRFGKPTRITARVSLGRGQLINIEREAQMSGKIHNKAFMILNGYLQAKFAQEQTLSFAASLVFEQVYDEVDGDSASAAELYALLSALSEAPVRQGIAVTGSINQLGEVQAIGGVNEKIEGFYAVCKAKGLTGEQGVIIPQDNVKNLMLRREVVDAVQAGKFTIWAVSDVDEGIEILTGVPAGRVDAKGRYPSGTIQRLCADKLGQLSKRMAAQAQRQRPRNDNNSRQPKETSGDTPTPAQP